ncbi:MAG: hypothetical protein HC887_09450 [Desulfobacteraceae bacterium]|nr:hypothetical protein [Desulfobacteraceae bacterium]
MITGGKTLFDSLPHFSRTKAIELCYSVKQLTMPDFSTLRNEFKQSALRKDNLHPDPLFQFKIWLNDAIKQHIKDANAMVLSTSTSGGRPSSRMVLLKQVDRRVWFFTNYESRKAADACADYTISGVYSMA